MRKPLKAESGDNTFTLTPQQWIKAADAIGTISKSERYGGTYATEADILNMALFGKTAAQWRNEKRINGKTPNIICNCRASVIKSDNKRITLAH